MAKQNSFGTDPNIADNDYVLGVNVADTTQSAAGSTANFLFSDIWNYITGKAKTVATITKTDGVLFSDTSDLGKIKMDTSNPYPLRTNPNVQYTSYNAGTTSANSTLTLDPANGNMQTAINGGAFTLAVPASDTSICLHLVNNATAGAVTLTGYTKTDGDLLTTTNGDEFFVYITRNNGKSLVSVKALQ
jgi:hypothetical protein